MSQANAEDFWRGTAAYNAGDWDAALAGVDPEVVFDLTRAAPEGETYLGHEGVRNFWRMLREVFRGLSSPSPRSLRVWGQVVRPHTHQR